MTGALYEINIITLYTLIHAVHPHLKYVVERVHGSVMARTLWYPLRAAAPPAPEAPETAVAIAAIIPAPPPPVAPEEEEPPPGGRVTFSEEKVTRRYRPAGSVGGGEC
jgi:hypothetical protein